MKQTIRLSVATIVLALPLAAYAQSASITRADFIVNMMASKGLYGNGGYCFPDVTNQAFAPAVCEAKARGYVTGYGDGRFHPYQSVTLVDAAVFAMRLERVSLPADNIWYRPAVEKLAEWDAIPESIRSIADPLSVSQANEVLISVRNRGDDDDGDEEDDVRHDDDRDDLTVSITDDPVRADEGDIIEYRIRVQNDDNDDVDVDIRAELDRDMSFVSATGGGDHEQDRVDWDDVNIDDDDDVVYTLRVRVRNNAGDTVKLRVRADDELDEELTEIRAGNDDDDDDDDNDNEDIRVEVEDSDDPVDAGDTVTYRIRIDNRGDSDESLDVEAELDDDMAFVSASQDGDRSGDTVEWDDVDVDEDDTETLLLTVRMDSSLDDGDTVRLRVRADGRTFTETTRIDDDNNDDDDDDANVTVSITEADDPVEEGEVITYRIRITNNENQIISIDPTAFLDEETSFVSASDGGDLRGGDEVEWENISIARDDTKTLLLSVRPRSTVNDGDSVRIRVEAGDDEDTEDTRVEENSDDDESDDIRVSITDSDDPAEPGDTVTYRIRIENRDNDDASVDVRARLDSDMTYVSSSESGDLSGSEVRWDNVDIDGDDDVTLILNVRIRTSADDGDTVRLDVEVEGANDTETTRIED